MSSNKILRYGALAGAVALPTMVARVAEAASKSASSVSASGTSTSVTVTVILEADLTGALTLIVSERTGSELDALSDLGTHINFGVVDSDGTMPNEGTFATKLDGAVYYKKLRADVDFAGYQTVGVNITGNITHSLATATNNARAVAACVAAGAAGNIGSTGNIAWGTAGQAYTIPAGGADIGTGTGSLSLGCFTATNTGGTRQTIGTNVDLAMFFNDAAPTGHYSATFTFTATANN